MAQIKNSSRSNDFFKISIDTVQDYFLRLGGSRAYSGYENWHSFAFVTLVHLDIGVDHLEDLQLPISLAILCQTGQLQDQVKGELCDADSGFSEFLSMADEMVMRNLIKNRNYDQIKCWGDVLVVLLTEGRKIKWGTCWGVKAKKPPIFYFISAGYSQCLAERQGFEPWVGY